MEALQNLKICGKIIQLEELSQESEELNCFPVGLILASSRLRVLGLLWCSSG